MPHLIIHCDRFLLPFFSNFLVFDVEDLFVPFSSVLEHLKKHHKVHFDFDFGRI